jgi:hypothetical protein
MSVVPAELGWATSFRETLDRLRHGEDVLDALIDQVSRAAELELKLENRWFGPTAGLAYAVLEPRLGAIVAQAEGSVPAAERERLTKEAVALRQRWSRFDALPGDFRARHRFLQQKGKTLGELIERIPADPGDIKKALPQIEGSFEEDQQEVELGTVAQKLSQILRREGPRLTHEAKRELLSYLIVAASLQRFLTGETVEQVAASEPLQAYGRELKEVGGALDLPQFGEKVESVFRKLGS